jgi:hypothetical protein
MLGCLGTSSGEAMAKNVLKCHRRRKDKEKEEEGEDSELIISEQFTHKFN